MNAESIKAQRKTYRAQNREKIAATKKAYREANREKVRAGQRRWEEANPEKVAAGRLRRDPEKAKASYQRRYAAKTAEIKAYVREWKRANPHAVCADVMARNAKKRAAMPGWANKFFISEAYRLAAQRTKVSGFRWVVDHIAPLRSDVVCGLHIAQNLRVIPEVVNIAKTNILAPDVMRIAQWQMS